MADERRQFGLSDSAAKMQIPAWVAAESPCHHCGPMVELGRMTLVCRQDMMALGHLQPQADAEVQLRDKMIAALADRLGVLALARETLANNCAYRPALAMAAGEAAGQPGTPGACGSSCAEHLETLLGAVAAIDAPLDRDE